MSSCTIRDSDMYFKVGLLNILIQKTIWKRRFIFIYFKWEDFIMQRTPNIFQAIFIVSPAYEPRIKLFGLYEWGQNF